MCVRACLCVLSTTWEGRGGHRDGNTNAAAATVFSAAAAAAAAGVAAATAATARVAEQTGQSKPRQAGRQTDTLTHAPQTHTHARTPGQHRLQIAGGTEAVVKPKKVDKRRIEALSWLVTAALQWLLSSTARAGLPNSFLQSGTLVLWLPSMVTYC